MHKCYHEELFFIDQNIFISNLLEFLKIIDKSNKHEIKQEKIPNTYNIFEKHICST